MTLTRNATRISPRLYLTLSAIKQHIAEHGWAPTLRELMAARDISSTSVARYQLERLEELGQIRLGRNDNGQMQPRAIAVVREDANGTGR